MSASDFLTEVHSQGRNKLISHKVPDDAEAVFFPRFRGDTFALLEVQQNMFDREGIPSKTLRQLPFYV